MTKSQRERRKYERYDTEIKIYFDFAYELKTKVKYQLVDKNRRKILPKKYLAYSKNVSAEGLSFTSSRALKNGDRLNLEIYLPSAKDPIYMEGQVRWSQKFFPKPPKRGNGNIYHTGVRLTTVNGESVAESIYFDKTYQVIWSIVLNSVLENFKALTKKRHQSQKIHHPHSS